MWVNTHQLAPVRCLGSAQHPLSTRIRATPKTDATNQKLLSQETTTSLTDRQLLSFERQGFCVTRQVVMREELQHAQEAVLDFVRTERLTALKQRIRVLCPKASDVGKITTETAAWKVLNRHAMEDVGFLQYFNIHRRCTLIHQLVANKAITSIAAQLLNAKKVRLYQDCVFYKEPGYAITNWHSDLRMAPLDTNSFVTAWIPFRDIQGTVKDSGLEFACGSHRDFALPFWHDLRGRDLTDRNYAKATTGAMQVGDVSWHHGWLLHRAGPQPVGTPPRIALAVCYFQDGARVLPRKKDPSVLKHMMHSEDEESYKDWLKDIRDGGVATHPLLPVVFP